MRTLKPLNIDTTPSSCCGVWPSPCRIRRGNQGNRGTRELLQRQGKVRGNSCRFDFSMWTTGPPASVTELQRSNRDCRCSTPCGRSLPQRVDTLCRKECEKNVDLCAVAVGSSPPILKLEREQAQRGSVMGGVPWLLFSGGTGPVIATEEI